MPTTTNPMTVKALATLRSIVDLCDLPNATLDDARRRLDAIRMLAIERAERLEGLPPL